jgi:hypothetical protein
MGKVALALSSFVSESRKALAAFSMSWTTDSTALTEVQEIERLRASAAMGSILFFIRVRR